LVNVALDIHSEHSAVHYLPNHAAASTAAFRLHLDVTNLSDADGIANVRASAERRCPTPCTTTDQLTLTTVVAPGDDPESWVPVTDVLTFPPSTTAVSQQLRLSVHGDPIRYPFDTWLLGVVITHERKGAGGEFIPVPLSPTGGELAVSVEDRVPRMVM